ncbi:MAG TPA: Gfo/Idh/MocA family oxidoreductase [Gemmatales bacterium]|nr:Gfo/Idh/MocA family oxidoreductase [Gemmatales bacterium]
MSSPSRRQFIQSSALAASAGYWVAGTAAANLTPRSPNEKLRIAGIGVGGKGHSDITQAAEFGDVVAICDIDDERCNKTYTDLNKGDKHNPKKYSDFRKMLEEMGKNIDAVTVSTPDHTHSVAAVMAMKMGKHVYCQKPLTHTVHEARKMRETASENKVVTQMGNQGSAENGLRRAVELIQGGVLGQIKEIHVWTNRPVWPQAPEIVARPATKAVPTGVHWDEFIGPAPFREYHSSLHPFAWRGFLDFGTGALGDMACHTANMAFRACKLGYPTAVSAVNGPLNSETYPAWASMMYEFPARGDMQPCKLYWYEGRVLLPDGRKASLVQPPVDILAKCLKVDKATGMIEKLSDSGSIIVGEKGILFSPNDYGAQYRLYPEKDFPVEEQKKLQSGESGPPITLARNNGGDRGMKKEWAEGIQGGARPYSNFDFAALFTETMLLGNVAMRVGKRIEWDGPNMKVTNCPEAMQYIQPEYRKGWSL